MFFTSDTHFGHAQPFIYEKRGFSSVSAHDQGIINSINAVVQADDALLHLGDFCLNTNFDRFNEILSQINCQNIYYVWGNHNANLKQAYQGAIQYFGYQEMYPVRYKNIVYLGYYLKFTHQKQLIIASHFPYSIWDEQKRGAWCITGHSHGGFPDTRPENKYGKILDVGWDIFKRPISFDELKKIMDKKQYVRKDGHH